MPRRRKGRGAKEAKALKLPRKEKLPTPLNSPKLRKPKQPGLNRRRALPLGLQESLKGSSHLSLFFGDPPSLWVRVAPSWMMPTWETTKKVGLASWQNAWRKPYACPRTCKSLGPSGNVTFSCLWNETLPRYIITPLFLLIPLTHVRILNSVNLAVCPSCFLG